MVPPTSNRVPRVRSYSGFHLSWLSFAYGNFTLFVCTFQYYSAHYASNVWWPITPNCKQLGLASFHFARRYFGNRCFFLFLGLLRCFSSPRSPRIPMYSIYATGALPPVGSPIRISAGYRICAPYRSFSQLITSFVGSQCLGIHLMLFCT